MTLLTAIRSGWAGREVAGNGRDSTASIQSRSRVQHSSLGMRDAISAADFALYVYLLAPSDTLIRSVDEGLSRALEHVDALASTEWAQAKRRQDLLTLLHNDILRLREVARSYAA